MFYVHFTRKRVTGILTLMRLGLEETHIRIQYIHTDVNKDLFDESAGLMVMYRAMEGFI